MYLDDKKFNDYISNAQCFCGNYEGIIEKKACMGNDGLKKVYITADVKEIQSWAFAYCDNLVQLWMPAVQMKIDKTFILGEREKRIIVYAAGLNGYRVCFDEALLLYYEFKHWNNTLEYCFADVGSHKWYKNFDDCAKRYIKTDDAAEYNPFLAGGEEDYEDALSDIEFYKRSVIIEKCNIVLERLMHDGELLEEDRKFYHAYISDNCEETLEAIASRKEKAIDYLKLCLDKIVIKREQAAKYISIFDGNMFAECKALILEKVGEDCRNTNVWSAFEL